ncbi:MAG: hypothetical protein V4586_08555 [Pseudomonadota bacterium]
MRHLIQTTALCLALATPASADVVYEGRDAQGLHCAAMLGIVAGALHHLDAMPDSLYQQSVMAASQILAKLPGTDAEKKQALRQRGHRIIDTRTPEQLVAEFEKIGGWCTREFLG